MREVTSDYVSQVKSGARQFGFYVNIYGNGPEPEALWLSDIISVEITRSASDQLQIGACMSDRLTLRTKATTLFNGRGKKVVVYYRCTAPILGWVRLGTFYVDECVTDRGVTAVTAYDMMSRLDKRISWGATSRTEALTFPCSMQDMLEYICARAGITTDFTCQNITIEKLPDGYTARELISYIAASHGANARFSPSEVLRIRTYTQTAEIIQYGGCYSMDIASDGGYTIKGILFDRGGGDTVYIDGTASEYDEGADGVVEAYNPFATVGIAEYVWGALGGLSYSAVSLEMPAQNILEPGDVFTVQGADGTEKTAVVMEQTLSVSCTGGFVETISCTAESKNQTRNAENRAAAAEKGIQNGVGMKSPIDETSEIFNCYSGDDANVAGLTGQECFASVKGKNNKATGFCSTAEGWGCSATQYFAHAEGLSSTSSGQGSHAEGSQCTASGQYSHAEGFSCEASGQSAHSEGSCCIASGYFSHAEGIQCKATAQSSHAEGDSCIAGGYCSHAEGNQCETRDSYSHAEGGGCIASGCYSHAEGSNSTASGWYSHAEGTNCTASSWESHAEGYSCKAAGRASHAGGEYSEAKGEADFAQGYGVITTKSDVFFGKAAFGRYNDYNDTNLIFVVGNGDSDKKRSNAFAVDRDGNIYCNSVIQTGGVSAAALLSDNESEIPEYNVKSENIVEFNGITYTFETNENGVITQVTTSDGKTMQANIPAEISNLQTHNAAFMALAMMELR